jgi:hypothetical protein
MDELVDERHTKKEGSSHAGFLLLFSLATAVVLSHLTFLRFPTLADISR